MLISTKDYEDVLGPSKGQIYSPTTKDYINGEEENNSPKTFFALKINFRKNSLNMLYR